jgi:hypothetical protein
MGANERYRRTPRGQYIRHKMNAKARGVPFQLTYRQWLAVWTLSGKWRRRGSRPRQYVMCRKGDRGPYAIGNVYIATNAHNAREANRTSWQQDGVRRRHTARSTTVTFDGVSCAPSWGRVDYLA